jgi:cell division protein FtsL
MAEPINTKERGKNWLSYILSGVWMTEDFVVRQSKLIILIVFLIIVSISNRYSCMRQLTKIENLRTKMEDMKYENLVISTELTSKSRQSQIEDLFVKKGIELRSSRAAVYEIHK